MIEKFSLPLGKFGTFPSVVKDDITLYKLLAYFAYCAVYVIAIVTIGLIIINQPFFAGMLGVYFAYTSQ